MSKQPVAMSQPTKPTKPIYACGYVVEADSYGMWAGPTDKLGELLDLYPGEARQAVIIRFNIDGTNEVIYKWHADGWVAGNDEAVSGSHTAKDIARVVVMEYDRCIRTGLKPTVDDYAAAITRWLLHSELPSKPILAS